MGSLFQELRRRNVFKVGLAYAVVAFALAQAADLALPTFGAPDWVNQTILFLFVLGFPLAVILAWAYELTPGGIKSDAAVQSPQASTSSTDRKLIYAILGLVVIGMGFQVAERFVFEPSGSGGTASSSSDSALTRRFLINLGDTVPRPGPETNADIALSPDGTQLAYSVMGDGANPQLYLLNLGQPGDPVFLAENGSMPFFSPDGQWLGFKTDGINKISVRGGTPQTLTDDARGHGGGFWSADDTIFFADRVAGTVGLHRIPAAGGVVEPLEIERDGSDFAHSWPHLLPDGDTLLFNARPASGARNGRVDLLQQSSGNVSTLIANGYNARYVPTGHIAFMRSASLWAVPFDLERLETIGQEVPVIQGIQTSGGRGPAAYAFSNEGLLVYLPGVDTTGTGSLKRLLWLDRDGNEESLPEERLFTSAGMEVSPDGERLAVVINENGNPDIWIYDLARSTVSRLTFDEASEFYPIWSPDGDRIVYGSSRNGGGIYSQAADGTGGIDVLATNFSRPDTFTPDGSQLVFQERDDMFVMTLGSESPPRPLIQTEFQEGRSDISPDGRWIAYVSNKTGRDEVYVRPFPDIDSGQWQISTGGGQYPKWSPNGRELFFRGTNVLGGNVWVANVETASTFQHETPVELLSGNYLNGALDLSADGSRFLMLQNLGADNAPIGPESTELVVVENWFEELKRLAPPDKN